MLIVDSWLYNCKRLTGVVSGSLRNPLPADGMRENDVESGTMDFDLPKNNSDNCEENPMEDLSVYREEITKIDEEIAALFEKRMHAAGQIATYKAEHGLPVRDPGTEEKKILRQQELIEDEELRPYYVRLLQYMMDLSCEYQEELIAEEAGETKDN